MTNFKITKDMGITKINATAKAEINTIVTNALVAAFGEDNVAMVRTGGSSAVNVLAVRVGTLTDADGYEHDLCVTVDATVKSYKEKVTKKYTVEAFDFDAAKDRYDEYLTDKAAKAAEAAAKKAVAKANGSKTKAEKEAAMAERMAELDAAAERAKAKQEAKLAEQLAKAAEKREAAKVN